ncbi:hypothetical protein EPUS_08024 [Endocarpon pusillum Z07020]|uniref:Uncharacterized protein n=1 Tax=Endocarpon pusillum (strain Z07020 / HMAS-L-300199) TaxID=1263415 RepID=U1GCP2_ENDPU|nr:uncharacterized protein EPUS_08024 [Endocarpon pusillum Z07020]ERF69823.1 hypothetical protein EPUS_08024 [Endocarpon pusillum Z07020]
MARVKKTSRAPPAGNNRGLAGVLQLDPTHAQPNHNQYNLHQLNQSFWEAPNFPESDFVRMRDTYQMPPPPPPAVGEQDVEDEIPSGDYDTVLEHTAAAGAAALTQPLHKKRKFAAHTGSADVGIEKHFVAGLRARKRTPSPPSRSSTDCQIRISVLESTLRILKDKKKELEDGLAMKKRAPDFGFGRVVDKPETKASSRHVTFVNYDAKEEEKMEHVRKRLKTLTKEFEVAKEEDDVEEMKRLTGRMSGYQRAVAELMAQLAERNAASDKDEDDEEDGDLPMSGMEG